jgi:glycosyltransferase involved in cell wall biosynthesis
VRALIDATALGSERGGDETMLRGIVRGLALAAEDQDRITVLGDPHVDVLAGAPEGARLDVDRLPHRPGARHFTLDLPWYLARHRDRFDVVFTVTHAPVRSPVPVALMVQDLSFLHVPDAYPRATRERLRRLVGHQAPRAAAVLTVSEFCRTDLIDSYGLDPRRVHVVPNTVEPPAPLDGERRDRAAAELARQGVARPFLLYLGNLHPRKNVPRALSAFGTARREQPALADHQFVVAGARWWGDGEREAAAASPPDRVAFLGRVDDDVRQLLLEEADALVYVSRFEGFGLPPLEAMAVDTPVLAAAAAAIPEVTDGAALLVDPLDVDAIAAGMGRLVTDTELRAELVQRGRARVAHYDARATGLAARTALIEAAALVAVP